MKNPFNGIIKDDDFEHWLHQFDEQDYEDIQKILVHFEYYSSERVFKLLNSLYNKLKDEFKIEEATTLFVPVGYIAKSGAAITYFFRRENQLDENCFIAFNDLHMNDFHRVKNIVFLDDFIGTGEYLNSIKDQIKSKISENILNRINIIFACVVGYEQGIESVKDENFKVCVADLISFDRQPLNEKSKLLFKNDRKRIKKLLLRYNEPLKPKTPLGYGEICGLVSFFFATPNNTLPMFWSTKNDWYPLFPRGDSRRNPNNLIVLPDFLQEHKIFSTEFNSKIKYSEAITKALLESFLSLDKMNIMAEIFSHLNFDESFILTLLEAIKSLQNLKHENNNESTALFFVDSNITDEIKSELVADANDIELKTLITQSKNQLLIVNGWERALAFDNYGKAIGILKYKQNADRESKNNAFDKYETLKQTSEYYHGLLILFTEDNRVLLFYNGDRLMTKKGKDWHVQGYLKNVPEIALSRDIQPKVLEKALNYAFRLSDDNKGGLLCIGDEDNVINHSSQMGKLDFSFRDNNILNIDESSFLRVAALDGAIIISGSGEILHYMRKLEPPEDVQISSESDRGTRHFSARKMSVTTKSVYIVVSSDGPISVYVDGDRIMKMLG